MHAGFTRLEGGLFSSVSKADVGDGAGKLIERGVDIMAWADPFFPDPSIPGSVKRAMIDAIEEGFPSHYSMPIGRSELRGAIAEKVARQTGRRIDPSRNVIVTPGSDSGLLYAMMPFLAAGTEVLVPEPSYPNNFLNPELLGAITVPVPLFAEDGYQLRVEELEKRLTPRTRMVVLCHPNNPTTTIFCSSDSTRSVAWRPKTPGSALPASYDTTIRRRSPSKPRRPLRSPMGTATATTSNSAGRSDPPYQDRLVSSERSLSEKSILWRWKRTR